MINSMFQFMGSEYVMKLTGTRAETRHDLRPDLAMFDAKELDEYMEKKQVYAPTRRLRMWLTDLTTLA